VANYFPAVTPGVLYEYPPGFQAGLQGPGDIDPRHVGLAGFRIVLGNVGIGIDFDAALTLKLDIGVEPYHHVCGVRREYERADNVADEVVKYVVNWIAPRW